MSGHASRLERIFVCIVASAFVAAQAESFTSQDLEFRSEGASLAGTLFLPDSETSPSAALVLLHGSTRDHSLRMAALAEALARDGFAVLTYDKRGVGKSEGTFQSGDDERAFALLAKDALTAVDVIANHPKLRGVPVGVLGISQGGWVAPIAASRSNRIAFMLLWSGPVCTVSEELHFSAFARNVPNFSMNRYSLEVREHMKAVPKRALDFDPRSVLRKVSAPTLWIFGGRDNSIPVELSIDRLNDLRRQGKSNFEYRVLPDGEHSLSYPDQAALDWMRKQAARSGV